jgi:hypothetical protein
MGLFRHKRFVPRNTRRWLPGLPGALAGLTSSPLKNNTGTLLTSAGCSAYVHNPTTGALVLLKTGLTSHASTGVVTFTDAALSAATSYRVIWKITSGGAEGMETLTAA